MISVQSPIAYLCAEFGIDSDLPWYAGGLGVLAGDILNTAARQGPPMVGVTLLYKGKNFQQKIDLDGQQLQQDLPFDLTAHGIFPVQKDGQPIFIQVPLANEKVSLQLYEKTLGSFGSLLLLDPKISQNNVINQQLADELYSGDDEYQIKQAVLLGVGGYLALQALGLTPSVFHLNEGRPALMALALTRDLQKQHNLDFETAWSHSQQQIVYTNHTLVAAGNKTFAAPMVKNYLEPLAQQLSINVDRLLELGKPPQETGFCFTQFSLNASRLNSGVSARHTELAQQNWPDFPFVNVTNGVDIQRWQLPELSQITLRDDPASLWNIHRQAKHQLQLEVAKRTGFGYDPDRLVITWARRVTGYKQLDKIFADLNRLSQIVKNPARPIQLLIAGKAHPGDENSKQMLTQIIKLFADQLSGHALFIPNYDLELAKLLTAGSDVWVNIPLKDLEACGTSGMKALSNGVLQATIAEGWAAEVNWEGIGWTLNRENTPTHFYDLLEHQIAPLYYQRDPLGLPTSWITRMQKSLALTHDWSSERVLKEYFEKLYQIN